MLHALALLFVASAPPSFDFYSLGPYDSAVPRPEAVLGYGPGEKHTTHFDQQRALEALLKGAPGKVRYIEYGKTWEGRPLRVLAISSPRNIARLEQIKAQNQALNEGRGPNMPDLPAIVWINEGIHGNETASFESGMWLAYTLLASRHADVVRALENTVVILNPSYNPDGHERYVVWYRSISTGSAENGAFEHREPSVIGGRTNHYRFDMNRDRVAFSQVETRTEVAEYLKWNPHVYVDQHGQVDTYFFPPTAMSVNVHVDRVRYNKWTEIFGRATGEAFDRHGFLYYIRNIFDLYYPGYLDSWTSLAGSIGMTHETDGGSPLARTRNDGTVLTLRDGMEKHFTSALAVIQSSAQNREALVTSFAAFKRKVNTPASPGQVESVIIQGPEEDLQALENQLTSAGIVVLGPPLPGAIPQGRSLWTGELEDISLKDSYRIVNFNQPQGAVARALLDPKSDFEPEFVQEQLRRMEAAQAAEQYPEPDGTEFYDTTAWNVVLAHNLQGWVVTRPNVAPLAEGLVFNLETSPRYADAKVGWALRPGYSANLYGLELMRRGARLHVTTKEMQVGGKAYPPGTLLVFRARNDENIVQVLESLPKRLAGRARPFFELIESSFPDSGREGPGSESVAPLRKPKIGVVFGDSNSITSFGHTWYVMEQVFQLPFTPLATDALNRDLSEYSAILLPPGRYGAPSSALREWVQGGGCLILLGHEGPFFGESGFVELEEKEGEFNSLPGALFRAKLDKRSFLAFGYERDEIAVPIEGGSFYSPAEAGGTAICLGGEEEKKLLSGWSWPDTEKAVADTAWLHDQPVGQGHVIWFAQNPFERAMWPGLHKLVLNAIVYGPRP